MSALAVKLRFARTGYGRAGLAGSLFLLALIAIGPFFAPHDPAGIAGIPLQRPNGPFLFGTDALGRDVLSRLLWGGRSIVGLAVLATGLAYVVGASIGLLAGYTRSLVDPFLMRAMDVLLAPDDPRTLYAVLWRSPVHALLLLAPWIIITPAVLMLGFLFRETLPLARKYQKGQQASRNLLLFLFCFIVLSLFGGSQALAIRGRVPLVKLPFPYWSFIAASLLLSACFYFGLRALSREARAVQPAMQ